MKQVSLFSSLLLLALCAKAQQPAAKQEVPDNLSEHAAPQQPLPYSHKTHLAIGLKCQQCHTNPEPGAQMTFPVATTCMMCHKTIAKDRPAIVKLTELAQSSQPIPWVRVYKVTPGVTWTHRKHLEGMAQTTSVLSMASCISCHQTHNAKTACATCHAWPAQS
jgi:hypothetical protein